MDFVQRIIGSRHKKKDFPEFSSGDTVSVSVRVREGNKERTQVFKGVCIKVQGSGVGRSFTVRKMSSGIGVERTFPFTSPFIEKIKVESTGKVRRSRLYYLRELRGRAARLQSTVVTGGGKELAKKAEAPAAEATEAKTEK